MNFLSVNQIKNTLVYVPASPVVCYKDDQFLLDTCTKVFCQFDYDVSLHDNPLPPPPTASHNLGGNPLTGL